MPESLAIEIAERGWAGDALLRRSMRKRMLERLGHERSRNRELWLSELGDGPIAIETSAANEQHYEVPAQFFELCLGSHLKYSCGHWSPTTNNLDDAEAAMLALTAQRAQLSNGQKILELGCGWGSLSLWMATHYPQSMITSVSNSNSQREFIEAQARYRGLKNLQVITRNMRDFDIEERFDRVVSVEMFEHMSNYRELLASVRRWLHADGKLFVHIFCHQHYSYPFQVDGGKDWMARHFFTGGIMPSYDIFHNFDADMQVVSDWRINGTHYEKTSNAWLSKLDLHADQALRCMDPKADASPKRQLQRWRMFYMACAELFGMHEGNEWFVGHYLLEPTQQS